MELIRQNSQARIKNDSAFLIIEQKAQSNKLLKNETLFPLDMDTYRARQKQSEQENKVYDAWQKRDTRLLVSNLVADQMQQRDTSTIVRNKKWIEELKKDCYLKETVKIMKDMQ